MLEKLGRYQILEKIGQGGFASVYRAHDTTLERDVALKELHRGLLDDGDGITRFIREARTIARLHHPHIVPIHDVIDIEDRLLIVMRMVEGPSLDKVIADRGRLGWPQSLEIIEAVAQALTYAHNQGILHRDLKPANIMLDPEHGAQLSDFGLAKLAGDAGSSVTAAGGVVGTPQYIAPEVWEAQGTTPQSDIYALGCILYELVTGQVLFVGDSAPVVMMAHFSPPTLPARWPDGVPIGLSNVLKMALARQPGDRFATAADMAAALTGLGAEGSTDSVQIESEAELPMSDSVDERGQLPAFLDTDSEKIELPVFVSREIELARLNDFLDKAVAGQGQIVFVTGEAGQGKTSLLVTEFARQALAKHPKLVMAQGTCVVYTGVGDPFLPFREIINMLTADVETRLAAGSLTRESALRLWRLLPGSVMTLLEHGPELIDTFVSGESLELRAANFETGEAQWLTHLRERLAQKADHPATPDQGRLFEAYSNVLKKLAVDQPLLLILDDLHWVDLSSVGLLAHLAQQLGGSPIMLIGTYRPEDIAQGRAGEPHPLADVLTEFKRSLGEIWIDLAAGGVAEKRAFVEAWLDSEPNRLKDAFRQELTRHTGGHPLFVVELLRDLQERGDLIRDEDEYWIEGPEMVWAGVPTRVEGVIEKRINRLDDALREVLTVASVEGEEFTAEVVARVQHLDERGLVRRISGELDKQHRLVDGIGMQRLAQQRLSRYRFHHNLFQKYLYDSLDEMERSYLHEDVGTVLETLHGEQAERIAVQLARHFQEAGIADRAVGYLIRAGEQALGVSAHLEAAGHFHQALLLLAELPESPERAQQEFTVQANLGQIFSDLKGPGSPEAGEPFTRALELARQLGEPRKIARILMALTFHARFHSDLHLVQRYSEECLRLAEEVQDSKLQMRANKALYIAAQGLGQHGKVRALAEWLITYYRANRATLRAEDVNDMMISGISSAGLSLVATGYPDRALQLVQEGQDQAREFDYRLGIAIGFHMMSYVHLYRGEWQAALSFGESLREFSTSHNLFLAQILGDIMVGIAKIMLGQVDSSLKLIQEAIASARAYGLNFGIAAYLAMTASGCGRAGRVAEGLALVNEALTEIDTHKDYMAEAWIHRVKGDLLLLQDLPTGQQASVQQDAETCFRKAIELAQNGEAKLWEARALASLCRLLHPQGRAEEPLQQLADLYAWFTEGFETEDLQMVKAVLEELS